MPHVVIIGASRGIGRELALQYADSGWDVLATVRKDSDAVSLRGVTAAVADVTDEGALIGLASRVAAPIDVLIVNAGVGSRERSLADVDAKQWRQVMEVNALGPLLVLRALAGKVADGGRVAALSSRMGSIGETSGGSYAYRMSKAALNMGLANFALEQKGRVAVAALHPGWVKTDMGGPGAQVEIADSAAGLRTVIASLAPGVKARFVDYRGETIGW